MTAEIAVLNKLAVTLAADSAVTINVGGPEKVYNSADKIFEISNYDPIGLMVYNNPEVQGIPIEVIAKKYRDNICKSQFPTVFEFASDFLRHLENMEAPECTVSENIVFSVSPIFASLKARRETEFRRVIEEIRQTSDHQPESELTTDKLESLLFEADLGLVETEITRLQAIDLSAWSQDLTTTEAVIAAHDNHINEAIDFVFDDTTLPEVIRAKLVEIGGLCLLKEHFSSGLTGLVFAGFGKDEIFPSLIAFEIYGHVAGRLKYIQTNKFDVDRSLVPIATVIPFAQQEMVDRFIYGMDNQFLQLCDSFFDGSLTALRTTLESSIAGMDSPSSEPLRLALGEAIGAIMEEFRHTLVNNHLKASRAQISDIIRSMPKQELAALSESLVHITSLKRKFSPDAESVGGPIDVAMITRAEGFVWVRRKHYFEPALNPRYFNRRYKPDRPYEEERDHL